MSKRKYVLFGFLLIVAGWACIELVLNSHWLRSSPVADVRIDVTGTAGAKVEGTFEVDGVASQRSGILPVSFHFPQARQVKFTITREPGSGEFWAKVFFGGEQRGSLGGSADWLRGMIERGSMACTCGQGEPKGIWEPPAAEKNQ